MKKYWKNVKNTGKVYEKILEKCKKNWKSQGKVGEIHQSKKVGTMVVHSVADPGFPIGGRGPIRGAWTSDTGTFQQKCMRKQKNWVP